MTQHRHGTDNTVDDTVGGSSAGERKITARVLMGADESDVERTPCNLTHTYVFMEP